MVRIAVPDMQAARAVGAIKEQIRIPLVVDIHFDYRLALECVAAGCDKVRINPGISAGEEKVRAVAPGLPGAWNSPSESGSTAALWKSPFWPGTAGVTPQALVDSAFGHIALLEKFDFTDICVSLKSSSVQTYHGGLQADE